MQDSHTYNHLGYTQDCPANSEKHRNVLYAGPSCVYYMGYMQDSNLTNSKPNPNPNLNLLKLTVVSYVFLFPLMKLINHANRQFLLPKVYNNLRWLAIDLQCPANH